MQSTKMVLPFGYNQQPKPSVMNIKDRVEELIEKNLHTEAAIFLANVYGAIDEVSLLKAIDIRQAYLGYITKEDQFLRDAIFNKYYKIMMS